MGDSADLVRLLTEIRDRQRQHLEEYRSFAGRSVTAQDKAAQRQAAAAAFARRVLLSATLLFVLLAGLLISIVFRHRLL